MFSQTPTLMTASRGLAVCIAIVVLQSVWTIFNSEALSSYNSYENAASRASQESSTLVVQREKSERKRGELKREREFWEKVPEDRVPEGAFWETVQPARDCRAYGKREYWGTLRNIPKGWSAIDACMNMPVEIGGVAVRRPYKCKFVDYSPYVRGYWMVDWDQTDCKPWHHDPRTTGCTSYRSGFRKIEAEILGIIKRKEQDWRLMCESTPLVWNNINYTSPTHCEERSLGRKFAMWHVPDESCTWLTQLHL